MYARRTILKGAAALPLAAILADPILSAAMAAETADVTIATPSGRNVTAALAIITFFSIIVAGTKAHGFVKHWKNQRLVFESGGKRHSTAGSRAWILVR